MRKRRRRGGRGAPARGRVTTEEILPGEILESVTDDGAGGVTLFLGTVRDRSEAGRVVELEYDSYVEMAEKRLLEIEREVVARWPVKRVRIVHRVGRLKLGDVSVAVAVSAPHRGESFEACRYAIERIKHDVPIWKRERLAGGGDVWVAGKRMGG